MALNSDSGSSLVGTKWNVLKCANGLMFFSFFWFFRLWLVGTKWNLLLLSEMASFLLQSALIWRHADDNDDDDDDDDDIKWTS